VIPLTHESHIRSYAVQGFARRCRSRSTTKNFLDEFRVAIWPPSLPTIGARDINELTYLPPIHIYRDTYLSSL